MIALLAAGWGALASWPLVRIAQREHAAQRSRQLHRPKVRRSRVSTRLSVAPGLRVFGAFAQRRRRRRDADEMARQLAVAVDLVGVAVGAGATPYVAVGLAARWAPPRVAAALDDARRECALGRSFDDALQALGTREPIVRPLCDVLRTSARLGSPVAPALARLAGEVRADLRRRAEARARTVPVRLCFPLVGCILPAFALLTVVPVVLDGLHG